MDDPNRNTWSPALNPRAEGREQAAPDSDAAMLKEGYRVLDRAERYLGNEREGLSFPVYRGGPMLPLDYDD